MTSAIYTISGEPEQPGEPKPVEVSQASAGVAPVPAAWMPASKAPSWAGREGGRGTAAHKSELSPSNSMLFAWF